MGFLIYLIFIYNEQNTIGERIMAKKIVSEGVIGKFLDSVADALKKGHLESIKKKVAKDMGLQKNIDHLNDSWEELAKYVKDTYGEEWTSGKIKLKL